MNSRLTTASIMKLTLFALLPGACIYLWQFGAGVLLNVIFAMVFAVVLEAAILFIRRQSLGYLRDGSALITGALLGLAVPPLLPSWMLLAGVAFALIFGKHVYGGLGENIFNPAMVGFAVLILSFPLAMSQWLAPHQTESNWDAAVVVSAKFDGEFTAQFDNQSNELFSEKQHDTMTGATPLDAYKFRSGRTNDEFFEPAATGNWQAWALINLGYLIGGLFLIYRGVIHWRGPASMLLVLFLLATVFYDSGSSTSLGSPLFHLFSGATMLAAFFVITDPVTCPDTGLGVVVFGMGVGLLTFIIRSVGAYPEGIAFAVLLMNAGSPLIDTLVRLHRQHA